MLWLGVGEGHSQLCALHEEVARRLQGRREAVAARPFRPHVTLGRLKRVGRADAIQVRAVLETIPLAVPSWLVSRVVLYESRLCSSSPTYHVLTSGPLASRPARIHRSLRRE